MRRQISSLFYQLIITSLLLASSSPIFGQKANAEQRQECAGTDYDCLIAGYNKEIQLKPDNAEAFYGRGIAYYHLQKIDLAMADFDKVISLNPKYEDAYHWRGYVYLQNKYYAEAIREFNRLKELNPANTKAVDSLKYIFSLIKSGSLPVEKYDELIRIQPNTAEHYAGRAALHFRVRNYDLAVEDASKAIDLNPKITDAYAVRSNSYCKLGKRDESNADIARYERLTGKETNAKCRYCAADDYTCQIGNITEEIVSATKKNASVSILNNLYTDRGYLYVLIKDLSSALSDFNRILTTNRSPSILSNVGDIYLRQGKNDEALAIFNEILSKNSNSPKTLLKVAEIYLAKRDYEKALEKYDLLIFLNPNSELYLKRAEIYLYFARSYIETETDKDKAEEYYKKVVYDLNGAIKASPKTMPPNVYFKRAEAYERIGEREKAEADRQKYRELTEKP